MINYTIFYKTVIRNIDEWPSDYNWDLFISAYNWSDRVKIVYDKVMASNKYWLIFPEYKYRPEEHPPGKPFYKESSDEAGFIRSFFEELDNDITKIRVCVDITGFIRPYLMFLIKWLFNIGLRTFDVLYSEPSHYARKEKTQFSDEIVLQVRQVNGFEGIHIPSDKPNDLLIIGAGYDHELITQVAESKDDANKIQIFGLPSLRADFYQENVFRAHNSRNAVGSGAGDSPDNYFAPAYDPFVTANVLQEIVRKENSREKITNLYLSPLATKSQVLGFTLYYLMEWVGKEASIIFPFCNTYSSKTSEGISRIWKYVVEFPA